MDLLRFDRFMEQALYHPQQGYYETLQTFGRSGDFYTAPSFHPLFSWTLARWVTPWLDQKNPVVVEAGAGTGDLADHALTYWKKEHPDLYSRIRYVIVERSHHLKAIQQQRLKEHPQVVWANTPPPYQGVFWANELLDALPVRVFRRQTHHPSQWEEMYVQLGTPPQRVWKAIQPLPIFSQVPPNTRQIEVAQGMEKLLTSLIQPMKEGVGILIDYGEEVPHLWERYPDGTLQGYRHHNVVDPLERPGQTDITAFVNFSHVQACLERLACDVQPLLTQERFLFRLAIHEVLQTYVRHHPHEELQARLAMKTLLLGFPTYRVLVFQKRPSSS